MSLILDTSNLTWFTASKTKPIFVRTWAEIFGPQVLFYSKNLLLKTLEANEPIDPEAVLCVGQSGDVWQQTAKAVDKKYEFVEYASYPQTGWAVYKPRDGNAVDAFEATQGGYIVGLWGEEVPALGAKNLQRVKVGDFICRQPHDHNDQWVVQRNLFLNSYSY